MPSIHVKKSVLKRLDEYRDEFKESTGMSDPSYSDLIESLFNIKNHHVF